MTPKRLCILWGLLTAISVLLHPDAFGETRSALVDKALDGDTLRLKDGRLVRYIGIDAPEIDHRQNIAEPMGFQAWALNRRYVDAKTVLLEYDQERKDHYGRLLAYVFTRQGVCVNQVLIEKGLAHVLFSPPNTRRYDLLLAKQRNAMMREQGLWHALPSIQGPFIGNARSKRFHRIHCPLGRRTAEKHRVDLKYLRQAYWQGFAPCAHCMPSSIKKLK